MTSSGSSAEVTSSKSITCGSIASARAIATRCCWPPERRSGYSSILSASPTRSSSASRLLACLLRLRPSTLLLREADVLERRLVREQVELLEDHADPPADEVDAPRRRPGASPVISLPSRKMRPSSGGSSRLMQRSSVDLPEPLGPITQTTSPRSTSRLTPRRTSSLPKRLWTFSSRSIGPSGAAAPGRGCLSGRHPDTPGIPVVRGPAARRRRRSPPDRWVFAWSRAISQSTRRASGIVTSRKRIAPSIRPSR